MAAVKGDTLLFQNSNAVGKVLGTGSAGGTLLALVSPSLAIAQVVQANADTDLAVAAAALTTSPPVGSFVTVGYRAGSATDQELYRVVGYATTAGYGAGVTLIILAQLNDPAQLRHVVFSGAGAVPVFQQGT